MISVWTLFAISLCYMGLLFAVANWGDAKQFSPTARNHMYSLSLGAYCTSWAFYGVISQAAYHGWWLAPTYAGSIFVFFFASQLQQKIATICKTQNLTSISDFISSRYGQSQRLGGLVTIIAVVAVTPYIALQLRAVTTSVNTITGENHLLASASLPDFSLYITLIMAAFAMLYGTRRLRSSENNPGLVFAIAFESVIKLIAFLIIGAYVTFELFDGWEHLAGLAQHTPLVKTHGQTPLYVYITHAILGGLAMFCLPRQFHLSFIEHNHADNISTSRWAFPLYLLAINVFTLPVAYAGATLFSGSDINPDTYILQIPISQHAPWLTMIVYIGGLAAATSMVIITTVVLSVMVSNNLVTPYFLGKYSLLEDNESLNPSALLTIRRFAIAFILIAAYCYHRVTLNEAPLANTGLIAFALVAQFAAPLLLGLVWKYANSTGARAALISGTFVWAYTLLLPTLLEATYHSHPWLVDGPLHIAWLKPHQLFGLDIDFVAHGALLSLVTNIVVFVLVSRFTKASIAEQLHTGQFLNAPQAQGSEATKQESALTNQDVFELLSRFIGKQQTQALFSSWLANTPEQAHQRANQRTEEYALKELSGVIGGASAKLVMTAAKQEKEVPLQEVVEIVDEASQVLKFNRELLQSTLENISQGVSVVDKEQRLVAWNRRYIQMFNYPDGVVYVGRPVEELIRYNAERGVFGLRLTETQINKRIEHLRRGSSYRYQRKHSSGTVYEMQGSPLPGGGFVTTFTDVTEYIQTQNELEEAKENLELKVQERTQALNEARRVAEQATISKTRFFAAAGHDLMQPFNAAMLFCSLLKDKTHDAELQTLAMHISNSLSNAEELLSSILELTKLDSGEYQTAITTFNLRDVTDPLAHQYQAFAEEKQLAFIYHNANFSIRSDKTLIRRILQNLLTNAIRYTNQGKVELICHQEGEQLEISVLDTGVGIPEADKSKIFQEFQQLKNNRNENGLGLGLTITQRMCQILDHRLTLASVMGEGSQFSIRVPIQQNTQQTVSHPDITAPSGDLHGTTIWVIDNDPQVLTAMTSLLAEWGVTTYDAHSYASIDTLIENSQRTWPDIVIADYQLDNGETGLELCQSRFPEHVPVIINSANNDEEIREWVLDAGYQFLRKPVKAPALKRLIKRLSSRH